MEAIHLVFQPLGRRCRVLPGDTIFMVAKRYGLAPEAVCNGLRSCGRCRVQVKKAGRPERGREKSSLSPITSRERAVFTPAELVQGWRLACVAKPLDDLVVQLPEIAAPRLIPTVSGQKLPVFECNHAGSEEVPSEIIRKFHVDYWDAYQCGPVMSAVFAMIADTCSDPVCKLPFCITIEAGAFGAEIRFPQSGRLPIPSSNYRFQSLEELVGLEDIDFTRGRIREVLEAVKLLHSVGRRVVLKVEAPFTVLSMLLEMTLIYKGMRQKPLLIEETLQRIRCNLVQYMDLAFAAGADIISYADPSGVVEFVGPNVFREWSGRQTVLLLQEVCQLRHGGIVHICGKTSTSLEYMGMASSQNYRIPGRLNFAQALFRMYDPHKIILTGHNCILMTAEAAENQTVSVISCK